ncbi:MAG: glycoside hydrolase family 3 C-terminal domain-containing protein, partial [Bacteroidales bacterium]|nr:glycoside hydrolase family 3 C-terminal domain-containing protein [Bacteroidales bacterium]
HFAAYSVPKGGRDGGARTDPHIAPRELHEIHLYPFRRVIMEADVLGVMSSYNDWDGVPVTGSAYFLTELLRKQYGFRGFVVSDSEAVEYLESKHHVAGDYKEAVRQSVEAGLNVRTTFREPASFIEPLRELVREGSLSMATIDNRVADVLRVKFELGLFDQPYVQDPSRADKVVYDDDAQLFSKRISRESLVLLKNENNILPLDKKAVKRVLVTGPNAAAIHHSISRYGPSNIDVISVLEGVKALGGSDFEVVYTKGSDIGNDNWPTTEILPEPHSSREKAEIARAVELAEASDVIIAVLGENEKIVGESLSRTSLDLPGIQQDLLKALYDTGKPVILVLINGRALTINWADKYVPGIIEAWFPGEYGGMAIAEALFGDYNPGGKLSVTFPKTVGQIEYNFPYKPGSHASQPERDPNNAGYNTRIDGFLYPFGFGLSYTSFEYRNLVVTPNEAVAAHRIQVQVEVSNTGSRAGDEVVQLYLSDPVSTVTTYVSLLRGFERIHLKPGETKTVQFELSPDDLSILDKDMKWGVEPGYYEVWIGASSEDIRLKQLFEIVE